MTDLHIHLLPGLDDGAQIWSEALRMAVHSGTFAIAATPHSNMPGFFETIWDARYQRRIQHLRELLEEQDIPLRVVEGMEIFATDDVLERLNSGQLIVSITLDTRWWSLPLRWMQWKSTGRWTAY